MSDFSSVDPVVSGVGYTVTSVNGNRPQSLDDFVARAVVVLVVQSYDQVVEICGSARLDGHIVFVNEKHDGGVGKDVRRWSIHRRGGQFLAIARAVF